MTLIQILSVNEIPAVAKNGKPYSKIDVAYKDLSYNGAVKGKTIMPFGDQQKAAKVLANAQPGETYEIQTNKNAQGYIDWLDAVKSDGAAKDRPIPAASTGPVSNRSSSFETPEERQKRQIFIVRQSSISNAVASLTPGAKAPLKASDVLDLAKQYEQWVFGIETAEAVLDGVEFEDMPD